MIPIIVSSQPHVFMFQVPLRYNHWAKSTVYEDLRLDAADNIVATPEASVSLRVPVCRF